MVQWLERLSPTSPRANAQKEIGFISALKNVNISFPSLYIYVASLNIINMIVPFAPTCTFPRIRTVKTHNLLPSDLTVQSVATII